MVRKLSTRKYVVVYIFTLLIFLVGISIGWQINNYLTSDVREGVDELRAQIFGLDLRNKLLEGGCDVSLSSILEDRQTLGTEVAELEDRRGKGNKEVLIQKELYQLTELNTWLLLKERKENCKDDFDLILFFYTNENEGNLNKASEDQGYVLDDLFTEDPSIITFSFDVNTDNPALGALREIYNITTVPTVVINGEAYPGFKSLYQINQILGKV